MTTLRFIKIDEYEIVYVYVIKKYFDQYCVNGV